MDVRSTGRLRLATTSAVAISVLLVVAVPNAFAYNLTGLYWPKVNQPPSTVVKILLLDSLNDQEINLKPVVRDTIDEYNALPALNPWLDEVPDGTNEKILVWAYTFADPEIFGQYIPTTMGNTLTYVQIKFNTKVVWKTTVNGSCYDPPGAVTWECTQDARKTSNHEMGHAQGLAHEFAPTVAVMRQGFLTYYHVRADDEDGIVDIYGAYNP